MQLSILIRHNILPFRLKINSLIFIFSWILETAFKGEDVPGRGLKVDGRCGNGSEQVVEDAMNQWGDTFCHHVMN